MNEIPILNFPTKIVLVDDNIAFLDAMSLRLSDKYQIETFNNVNDALNQLCHKSNLNTIIENSFHKANLSESDEEISHPVFDYNSLSSIIYNKERFGEVSVVVSDYSMPGQMDGIDFCKHIMNLSCRKVILTGEADNQIAVDAFNKKLIDRFLHKDIGNLIENLIETIEEEINNYFKEISIQIPGWNISGSQKHIEQKKIFQEILQQHKIIEYYQINENEYIMLNNKAKVNWLIFQSIEKHNNYYNIAEENDAEKSLLTKLKDQSHMIYLFSNYENKLPVKEWNKYIFPVKGKSFNYVYTYIEDNEFSLDKKRIKSYSDFLKTS